MRNGGEVRREITQIFEKIETLEQEKGSPLSLREIAEEINTSKDLMKVLKLFQEMGLIKIKTEESEVELTGFAKNIQELP